MNTPLSRVQPNLDNVEAWLIKYAMAREEVEHDLMADDKSLQITFNDLARQMLEINEQLFIINPEMYHFPPEVRSTKTASLQRRLTQTYVCLFGLVVLNHKNNFDEAMARMRGAWSCVPHMQSDTPDREWRLAMAYLLEGNPAYINKFVDALYAIQREYPEITCYTDVQAELQEDRDLLRERVFGSTAKAIPADAPIVQPVSKHPITALPTGDATELD
jgi:hypothetical protein